MGAKDTNEKADSVFSEKQNLLIELLADGNTVDQCVEVLVSAPHLVPKEDIESWIRDPELLRKAIDRGSDLLGQAWGTMWKQIKLMAMTGSVPHSKLLIEYIQNKNKITDSTYRLIFGNAVDGLESDPE